MAKVPKHRPRTKHIAVKYHHFREWVTKGILSIERVQTSEEQADIFTKPLTIKPHEYIREKIMGWWAILTRTIEDETTYENHRYFTLGN